MKKYKYIKIVILTVIIGYGFYTLANTFSPGINSNAEIYELNCKMADVKNVISDFKRKNPTFITPTVTIKGKSVRLSDTVANDPFLGYDIYFYHKDEKKILSILLQPSVKNKTALFLISVNDGLKLGNWRRVNADLGFFENRKIKKDFEDRILNQVKSSLLKDH